MEEYGGFLKLHQVLVYTVAFLRNSNCSQVDTYSSVLF